MALPPDQRSKRIAVVPDPGTAIGELRALGSHSQTVTYEFFEDGRPDRAAARLAVAATSHDADEATRLNALRALEELAEQADGRVARRILVRFYRAQNHAAGVDQIHNIALQLGTAVERVHVLVERNTHLLDEGTPLGSLVASSLTGIDHRQVSPGDIGYGLVRTWLARPHFANSVQLLDQAAESFDEANAPLAALTARLLALREYAKKIQRPSRVEELIERVLPELSQSTPRGVLENAAALHDFPRVSTRANELLAAFERPTIAVSSSRVDDRKRTDIIPLIPELSDLRRSHHDTNARPLSVEETAESKNTSRGAASSTEEFPALIEQSTTNRSGLLSTTPLEPDELKELLQRAKAEPQDMGSRERLAAHYRTVGAREKELAILGDLAAIASTPSFTANCYRRSAELLLELGDRADALRVRLEAMYLSSVREDDEYFILSNTTADVREETIKVLGTFIPHLVAEEGLRLAKIGAQTLIEHPSDAISAWKLLFPAWISHPNNPAAIDLLMRVARDAHALEELQQGVCALAAQGTLRDTEVVRRLMDAARTSGQTECYILLHICATAASPLSSEPRRALDHVITVEGRSRASAYRQVLAQLRDLNARREWTLRTVSALEAEHRFAEAAELLIEQHTVDSSDHDSFDRAVINLERERQYPRIITLLEGEINRLNPAEGLLSRLRHLSRICRFHYSDLSCARDAAVRIALTYPANASLDAHARAELADATGEQLAQYLEQRAKLLGKSEEAADLYLEAADTLLKVKSAEYGHIRHLLFNAQRCGATSEPIRHRLRQIPASQETRKGTGPVTAPLTVVNSAIEVSGEIRIDEANLTLTSDFESAHVDPSVWWGLFRAQPNERRRRFRTLLSQDSLEILFDECIRGDHQAEAIASAEFLHLLHHGLDDQRQNRYEEAAQHFRPVNLVEQFDLMLSRARVSEDCRADLLEALGDPQEALMRIPLRDAAQDETIDSSELAGISADEWISLYVRNRVAHLHAIATRYSANSAPVMNLIDALPWTLAWYGTASILVILRRFCRTNFFPRPTSLEELLNACENNTTFGMILLEWADSVIAASDDISWEGVSRTRAPSVHV